MRFCQKVALSGSKLSLCFITPILIIQMKKVVSMGNSSCTFSVRYLKIDSALTGTGLFDLYPVWWQIFTLLFFCSSFY